MLFFEIFLKTYIVGIGHFQSIKPAVLHIFSLITIDKTDVLSPVMFSNLYEGCLNWNLTFKILSDQFLAFVYFILFKSLSQIKGE